MRSAYDVVVVGGGPAGCAAAEAAAREGVSVLLVEKDREIGVPVRCAEGVDEDRLRKFIEPDPRWICNQIKGVKLVSPAGTAVEIATDRVGYILDRRLFDQELARRAAIAGAEITVRTWARGLQLEDGKVKGVGLVHLDRKYEVQAQVVIGADGVESRVGRWAGLKTALSLHDLETCAQYTLIVPDLDPDYCELHFGSEVAPGGYLWVFPKGKDTANVGVGISGNHAREGSPFWYLDRFIAQRFPQGTILSVVAGGVPCAPPLKELVTHGLMLVGDAARQTNPLTGAGIMNALEAGTLAGQVAAQAVKEGNPSRQRLLEYQKEWHRTQGKSQRRYYRLKEGIIKLSDETLNSTAEAANRIEYEKRTLARVFSIALMHQPKLVLDALKLFAPLNP